MRFLYVFMFLCLNSVFLIAQNTQQTQHPNQTFQKAVDLVDLKQYAAAQEIFNEYLNQSAVDYLKKVEAEYFLAICALELTQPTAEALFIDFVETYPHHPKSKMAYYSLGNFYFDNEDYKKAITYLEKIDPLSLNEEELLKSKFNLGYAHFTEKKYKKALKQFNEVKIESSNNKYQYVAYYYAGYINYKEKHYSEALDDLKEAEENETYKKVVPYMIVNIYNRQKDYKSLIDYAEEKLSEKRKYSNESDIRMLLGEAYYQKEKYSKALPHFQTYVDKKGTSNKQMVYRLGDCYFREQNYEKAEEYLKLVASSDDEMGQTASYYLGHIYLKIENQPFALSALEKASEKDYVKEIQEQALFDVGKLYYQSKNFDRAVQALKTLNEKYPSHLFKKQVRELLSESYLNTNNYEEAITYIDGIKNQTTSIQNIYQQVTYRRAIELYNKRKFKSALGYFEKSVHQGAEHEQKHLNKELLIQAYFWKGELNSILRNWQEAQRDYAKVFALTTGTNSPYRLKTRYGMGYVYFNNKEYDKAKTHFVIYTQNLEKAKDKQDYGNALLRVGDCYFFEKNYPKSLEAYDKSISNNNKNAAYAYLKKAEVLGFLQKLDEANKTYDIVIKQYANSPYRSEATYKKAVLSLENSLFQDAVKNFTYFLINEPTSSYVIESYLRRGIAYQNLKDYNMALTDFDKVLKDYCRDTLANQALSASRNVLVSANRLSEYDARLNKYFECNPDDPSRVDKSYELALALYRSQKYVEAIQSFDKITKDFPKNTYQKEITNYTANAYYLNEDYDNALIYFKKVEKLGASRQYQKALGKMSKIYFAKEDYVNAKSYNLKLLPLATSQRQQARILSNLMNAYYQLEQLDSAKIYANQIVEKGSPITTILYQANLTIAKIEYEEKQLDKALDEFIALMNKATADERGAEANYYVGKILFETGKKTQAINSLENLNVNFVSFEPWVGKSYLLISDIYIDMNEDFQARSTLESLVKYFPLPDVVKQAKEKLKKLDKQENLEVVEEEVVQFDMETGEVITEIKKDTINTNIPKGGTENE